MANWSFFFDITLSIATTELGWSLRLHWPQSRRRSASQLMACTAMEEAWKFLP
jgi:hypothetical protein